MLLLLQFYISVDNVDGCLDFCSVHLEKKIFTSFDKSLLKFIYQ